MMLIESCGLPRTTLKNKTVLLTGAGGGIGFEAARCLCWLGARIIIAECDAVKGEAAQKALTEEFGEASAAFFLVDISDDAQLEALRQFALNKYGFVDVLFHNATITPMGAVDAVAMKDWDKSYAVNFRAPLMLTRMFLPEMKKCGTGVIVFVPSSGAAPYMGAYEVFKTTQVELCSTLAGELENTGVYTYAIGPGLVKTETAAKAIDIIAGEMGMSAEAFYAMNEKHILSIEEAGAGFALSVVHAERYHGMEVSSIQALIDSGVYDDAGADESMHQPGFDWNALLPLVEQAAATFREQYEGWKSRNVFERQWVLRDFKKTVGEAAEQFEGTISRMEAAAKSRDIDAFSGYKKSFVKLKEYYQHQYQLLQGYERDKAKLQEHSAVMMSWIENLDKIIGAL